MPTWVYHAIGITGDVLASSGTIHGLEYWMNQGINQGKPYTVKKVGLHNLHLRADWLTIA